MYNSQHGQDMYINEKIFHNKKNGIFLDIGAHNGVAINNSLFFEKELNWSGVCVEPMPDIFKELEKNRNCICINGCVTNETKKDKFLRVKGYPEMLSGLVSEYNENHLKRIDYEIQLFGGSKELIDVNCYNINEILEKYNLFDIDYCSIDTEGNELKILKSIDFSKFKIKCFTIENNYTSNKLKKFMISKNYLLKEILGCDEVYVLKDL